MAKTRAEIRQTYKEKCLAEGRCLQCGKPNDRPGVTRCSACKERKRIQLNENRKACVERGICPRCCKTKLWGEEKACIECMAKDYEMKIKYRSKNSDKIKAYSKTLRKNITAMRREQGICTMCGKRKAGEGYVTCKTCRAKKKVYRDSKQLMPRSERMAYGLCYRCGNQAVSGTKLCDKCLEHMRMMTAKSLENRDKSNYKPFKFGRELLAQ